MRHVRLIRHLETLPTSLSSSVLQSIFAKQMDLFGLYELLQDYPDEHCVMMAVSRQYLRLAIERGADLRQSNTSGNSPYDIALMYESEQNSEIITKWLKNH